MNQTPDQAGVRDEDEIHLRDIWNLLLRNWWLIGLSLFLGAGAAAWYSWYVVPVYQAGTSIRIEGQQADVPLLDILQDLKNRSEVASEMEVLRSRTLAEDVVDSLGLQVQVSKPRGVARQEVLRSVFVERWAPAGTYVLQRQADETYTIFDKETGEAFGTTSATVAAALPGATFQLQDGLDDTPEIEVTVSPFASAVRALQGALSVSRPNREAGIVAVQFQSADTQLVHAVPNALAKRFIARGQAVRKTEATSMVSFLEEQIDTLEIQLRQAEEALTAFREGEQVVSLQAEADAQVTNLSRLQADRNTIEAERTALETLVNEIEAEAQRADATGPSPYIRLISFPTLFSNPAASQLLGTLNQANAERSQLLQRRTLEDPDVVNLTERIHDIEAQLRSTATTYLQGLTEQVAGYDRTLAQFASDLERIPAKEVQLVRLQRQQSALENVYTLLQGRLQEARILEAVEDATVRIIDSAILTDSPVRPRRMLNTLLGAILGALAGIAVAVLRDYLDETVHTHEDVREATLGAPVLGMIPRIRDAMGAAGDSSVAGIGGLNSRLVTGRDPRNPVSEAYRNLRTNLTFANPDHPPKTIVVTSALPQDGKSTSAANLCITLAQQGIRALLMDADLRRGVLNNVFQTEREPGLTTILTGQCGIGEAIQKIDLGESGTLDFLPSGGYPPNPAEILGSQRMRSLIEALEERYDLIIVDTAPLTVVTDAAVLGTNADGVVLIARANVTEKGALSYAVEQLRNVRATVLGAVVNDVDFRRDSKYQTSYGRYGYYYHYYYTDGQKKGRKSSKGSEASSRKTPSAKK